MLEGSPYLRHHCAALHVEACVAMTSRPGATQLSHSAASLFCCPFLLSTARRMCNCLGIYAVKFLHFFLSSFAFLFPSLINQLPQKNYHSVERLSNRIHHVFPHPNHQCQQNRRSRDPRVTDRCSSDITHIYHFIGGTENRHRGCQG